MNIVNCPRCTMPTPDNFECVQCGFDVYMCLQRDRLVDRVDELEKFLKEEVGCWASKELVTCIDQAIPRGEWCPVCLVLQEK